MRKKTRTRTLLSVNWERQPMKQVGSRSCGVPSRCAKLDVSAASVHWSLGSIFRGTGEKQCFSVSWACSVPSFAFFWCWLRWGLGEQVLTWGSDCCAVGHCCQFPWLVCGSVSLKWAGKCSHLCHGAVVGTPCRRQQHRGGGQGLYQDSSSTAALLLAGFGFLLGKLEGTRCDSRCQAEPAGWAEET